MELTSSVIGEFFAQLVLKLAFELRCFCTREIEHQDAWFLMAPDDRDEQLNPIRATVTRRDADHFDHFKWRILVGGDVATDRGDGVEIQCHLRSMALLFGRALVPRRIVADRVSDSYTPPPHRTAN